MGPCPVRAPPGALTGFSCRAPENNSKIFFPACNHFESEGTPLEIKWGNVIRGDRMVVVGLSDILPKKNKIISM